MCGPGIEPRKQGKSGVPTPLLTAEGCIGRVARRRLRAAYVLVTPCGGLSKPAGSDLWGSTPRVPLSSPKYRLHEHMQSIPLEGFHLVSLADNPRPSAPVGIDVNAFFVSGLKSPSSLVHPLAKDRGNVPWPRAGGGVLCPVEYTSARPNCRANCQAPHCTLQCGLPPEKAEGIGRNRRTSSVGIRTGFLFRTV
jgi:hypothetical protein